MELLETFEYDATDMNKPMDRPIIPPCRLNVIIRSVDKKISKKNNTYYSVKVEVDEGEYLGAKIWGNVTAIPAGEKGAGMFIHWLKSIGEPFEGKFTVNPNSWIGRRFVADISDEEYEGKKKNVYKAVSLYEVVPF